MCFSPEADIGGGLLICAIGVDAVRHIGQRREFIAMAWIPVLLGAHQFIEALVWLWLQGHVPRGIGHVALWAYLLIAFVVLPVFIPLAVIALEPTRRRKLLMAPFALIGGVVAVILLAAMTVPTTANGTISCLRRLVGSSAMTARGMNTGSTTKAISR